MRAPISWLNDYVDINVSPKELADRMTLSGSKVEGIHDRGEKLAHVVAAKILEVKQHPNADKLKVAKVSMGSGEPVQIVTGAENITEESVGKIIPAALVGADLPNGVKISKGKLRGEVSDGMMCSGGELCADAEKYPDSTVDGIWILPDDTPAGMQMKDFMGLTDTIIEFEITPNRPDCLSMIGLAREAAVTLGTRFRKPGLEINENSDNINNYISVEVKNFDLCPRYAARVVTDVVIGESPSWLKEKLESAGIRAINNIVDITNFVMLETGQPMHAFDLNYLDGNQIIVRNAKEGEIITTLDGKERKLESTNLVIADTKKAVAIAGVMGGENSEVTDSTQTVVFESANFNGAAVRRAAKKVGLRTESSSRFEKGLDIENVMYALNRAVTLTQMIGAGNTARGIIDCKKEVLKPREIDLDPAHINHFLGTDISKEQMVDVLHKLEFEFSDDFTKVIVPGFRADVECKADVAEEIARFYDYNNIKPTLLFGKATTMGGKTSGQKVRDKIADTALACGYSEIYTYSFTSPKIFDKLRLPEDSALRNAVMIANPLGEDYGVMRTETLGQMIECLSMNYNRRNP